MSDNNEITIIDIPETTNNMPENTIQLSLPNIEISKETNVEQNNMEDLPENVEQNNMENVAEDVKEDEVKGDDGAGVLVSEEVLGKVSEEKIEVIVSAVENPLGEEMDKIVDEGLAQMVSRYLEDDVIDNDEMVDLVQYAMELAERKRNLTGPEKKQVAMVILRKFMEKRVKNWGELEKLISKTIDFAVDVSRNGIQKMKLTSNVITESKTAFNLIYSSAMSQINAKYPLADDIVNNFFDIAKHILELMEGQTSLSNNEKKVLLKKILNTVIEALTVKLNAEQKSVLVSQVDSTVVMIMIGLRVKDGEVSINPEEVMTLMGCLFGWMRKCSKKKK